MAYYSMVKISMLKDNYEALIEKANREKQAEVLLDPQVCNPVERKDGTVVMTFNWIKWSEMFEDCKFVLNFLDEMASENYPYTFIRIGEELGDLEEVYFRGVDDDDYSCDNIHLALDIVEDEDKELN